MKTKITLLAIVACALLQVAASADQPVNQISVSKATKPAANAANAVTKPKSVVVTPLSKSLPPGNDKIQRVGNVSSRPWTQTVGWTPGKSEFATESAGPKDQGWTLFWIGHEPW
jgi:hypothetical protein